MKTLKHIPTVLLSIVGFGFIILGYYTAYVEKLTYFESIKLWYYWIPAAASLIAAGFLYPKE